jgi:hypothetical protein
MGQHREWLFQLGEDIDAEIFQSSRPKAGYVIEKAMVKKFPNTIDLTPEMTQIQEHAEFISEGTRERHFRVVGMSMNAPTGLRVYFSL